MRLCIGSSQHSNFDKNDQDEIRTDSKIENTWENFSKANLFEKNRHFKLQYFKAIHVLLILTIIVKMFITLCIIIIYHLQILIDSASVTFYFICIASGIDDTGREQIKLEFVVMLQLSYTGCSFKEGKGGNRNAFRFYSFASGDSLAAASFYVLKSLVASQDLVRLYEYSSEYIYLRRFDTIAVRIFLRTFS